MALEPLSPPTAHSRMALRARDLYAIYCASSGGVNFQGNPCPAWDDLPQAIRDNWYTVALRSLQLGEGHYVVDKLGDEREVEPNDFTLDRLSDREKALEIWRRYSGIASDTSA